MSGGRDYTRASSNDSASLNGTNDNKISNVQAEIDKTKGVIQDNIELIIERGEKIDNLEDKSQNLVDNASMFQKKAKRVRRKYWCMNLRNTAILVLVCLIVIWLLSSFICGFSYSKCRSDN